MARASRKKSADVSVNDRLAVLIEDSFPIIREQVTEKITIGEFLKMVELYHKLSPRQPNHKEFWDMLDKIRKQALGEKKSTSTPSDRSRPGMTKKASAK